MEPHSASNDLYRGLHSGPDSRFLNTPAQAPLPPKCSTLPHLLSSNLCLFVLIYTSLSIRPYLFVPFWSNACLLVQGTKRIQVTGLLYGPNKPYLRRPPQGPGQFLRIRLKFADVGPKSDPKPDEARPRTPGAVPTNRHKPSPIDFGPVSGCFHNDPKLLNCKILYVTQ